MMKVVIFLVSALTVKLLFAVDKGDKMVWLQGGSFWMGGNDDKKHTKSGKVNNEQPVHEVALDGFWIDIYPVTNLDYERFVESTGYKTYSEKAPLAEEWPGAKPEMLVPASIVFQQPDQKVDLHNHYEWWAYVPGANWQHPEGPNSNLKGLEDHPVVHVTYEDAQKYCEWRGKTLPTEAQWEYAARGGLSKKKYVWGNEPKHLLENIINYWQGDFPYSKNNKHGFTKTSPVGAFPPNHFGLYDMAGNVWEWVSDWYHPRYYEVSPRKNPTGVKETDSMDPNEPGIPKKIVKGGSFLCSENYCRGYRPSARMPTEPKASTNHIGFRCVKNQNNLTKSEKT